MSPCRYGKRNLVNMRIEKAKKEDLKEIYRVVRESIVQLCVADHHNNDEHISNWLKARSETEMGEFLFNGESQAFVCRTGSDISGMSHIKKNGEITLCYVHPQYLGQGIGQAVLSAAEKQALQWSIKEINLTSTSTAREFYIHHGFTQCKDPITCFGMPGYPLKKTIASGSISTR